MTGAEAIDTFSRLLEDDADPAAGVGFKQTFERIRQWSEALRRELQGPPEVESL